jgi:hypothetical protein
MMVTMDIGVVVERVERVSAVRADTAAGVADLEAALRDVGLLQSWLTGAKAALTSKLAAQVSFPEKTIADCTRGSANDAIKDRERSRTLDSAPSLADALDEGVVTAGHVDEVTRATKSLDGEQREELLERLDQGLLDVAAVASVEDWRRRLAVEVRNIQRDDGIDKLTRQRRAVRVRTWTDADGMWCLSGRFDPVTGVKLSARIDAAVNALFAEHTPDTCPTDPVEKQQHLAGLAVADLLEHGGAGTSGRPEYIVVIDTTTSDGASGPVLDWGIPVEIPYRILTDMIGDQHVDVHAVVVRNGVIIHAPGDLNLGRTTRLANRAQRRALRALYSTCAIPGCRVRYDRCKLHHIIWWRNSGRTDLHNLLPVCPQHHARIHDAGWDIALGPNRELTITFPDGTIHNTGPPKRTAA